ncbi:hypothetical protein ACHAWF_017422, partial [Thalassiosira exigua]
MESRDLCVENSERAIYLATRPTGKPTRRPSPRPTRSPQEETVYYPDLQAGVCKSDGRHGDVPYRFSSPEACCANKVMDYGECLAHARPYHHAPTGERYVPDVYEGRCEARDVAPDSWMAFDTAEECCDGSFAPTMYRECLVATLGEDVWPDAAPAGLPPAPGPVRWDVDPASLEG